MNNNNTLTREYFIQQTGVFVSHIYYDLMIKPKFEKQEKQWAKPIAFCNWWYAHNSYNFIDITDGNLKICCDDESLTNLGGEIELEDMTVTNLLDNLSEDQNYWYKRFAELQSQFNEFSNSQKILDIKLKKLDIQMAHINENLETFGC